MSFIRKLFGKNPSDQPAADTPAPAPEAAPLTYAPPVDPDALAAPAPADPARDPNMIRVVDDQGREMFVPREQWRDTVVGEHLPKIWGDPDALCGTILQGLNNGFQAEMLEAAEHLVEIDPSAERSAVVLSIVYRELQRLDDSEQVLRTHIERHGESGVVLTNLAKIQSDRGDSALSLDTLWHSLELDPNQESAFGWYLARHRETAGASAELEAIMRVSALPGSWLARLGLAREAVARRQVDEAKILYRQALAMAGKPVPTALLVQLTGDLGNAGHLAELLALAMPPFEVAVHGLPVGNNLLKANLELGRFDTVRTLLDQLFALQRPEWRQPLAFWDSELTKARIAANRAAPQRQLSIAMLVGEAPVWMPPGSPAGELFPAPTGEPARIAFLGSTAEVVSTGEKAVQQMSDAPGRMSRALSLFLAEQVRFGVHAQARLLVPWAQGEVPAFVLGSQAWRADEAARHARSLQPACDYCVVTHVKATAEPWQVELSLVRARDAAVLGTAATEFTLAEPESAVRQLAADLLALLAQQAGVETAATPELYQVPAGPGFTLYLLRLEQLLAVQCGAADPNAANFLCGERDVLDGNLHLCLAQPANVVLRLLFIQTLQFMQRARPQVVAEYRERVLLLQREKPLASPSHEVLQGIVEQIYP